MALPRPYMVVLLLVCYSLEKQELMGTESHIHARDKRATVLNSSDFVFQVVLSISNLENIQMLLNIFSPMQIDSTAGITSIEVTTVCSSNINGYQCICKEGFAWSSNNCNDYGACDAIIGDTCGCINALPADGKYCQLNASGADMTTTTPVATTTPVTTTTPIPKPTPTTNSSVNIDIELDLHIPTFCVPSHITDLFGQFFPLPYPITQSLKIIDLHFTTDIIQCSTPTHDMPTPATPAATPTVTPTPAATPTPTPTATPTATPTPAVTPAAAKMTPTTATQNTMTTTKEQNFMITMDMDFDSSYNNPASQIYKDINNSIQQQCKEHISTLQKAQLIGFRSGSTIADYIIRATSFQETEIKAVQKSIFTQLAENYPVLIQSPNNLQFDPSVVFWGETVTVKCGPPDNLIFSSNWTAEWRLKNNLILEDTEHHFSTEDGAATLTVTNVFSTDNGFYECKLKHQTDKSVFRQNGTLTLTQSPLIQVTPIRTNVQCEVGNKVLLQCSVNSPYEVMFEGSTDSGVNITYQFSISDCGLTEKKFTCYEKTYQEFKSEITVAFFNGTRVCVDTDFGDGAVGDKAVAPCKPDSVGEKSAVCMLKGGWEDVQNNCILRQVQELLIQSKNLNNNSLPGFLQQLSNVTINFSKEVVNSSANINATVVILNNVANVSKSINISINPTSMKDILLTAGVLTTDGAKNSWNILNAKTNISETTSVSSTLLFSLENITKLLTNDSFDIVTPSVLLNKTAFTDMFNADFNSSVEIIIPESDGGNQSITVITFASMDNVLPARDKVNSTNYLINGKVVLVQSSGTINNISFTFGFLNNSLQNPQCVFWNFSLFNGLGGWDDKGCTLVHNNNDTVTCNCNHLTSFSILMSPNSPDDPVLNIITYIGVGISMASLVICLITEAVIWKKIRKNNTSHLRHVSIVNIAVSLLIANIWFIIGAAISNEKKENPSACNAATFFIHLFYLATFFWMLALALLLLYRTVSVFDGGLTKRSMLAIGFSLGYGAPLIIAVITIAVTAPKSSYIRGTEDCWLNWKESRALLAFVIPALSIVVINLVVLLVVIYKILKRGAVEDASQKAERHILVVIARSLAVLTPFFGLTWILGFLTINTQYNRGIHISFAFFNSLQGFFILVFGTLLDKKVRLEIVAKSQTSWSRTRSNSAGISSSSRLGFFRNWGRRRDGYNTSSSPSSTSLSFTNS